MKQPQIFKPFLFVFIFVLISFYAKPQLSYFKTYENNTHFNYFLKYNAPEFATTMKGFGSIGWSEAVHIVTYKKNNFSILLGTGLAVKNYRFEDNLQLTKTAQKIEYSIVTNAPYIYKNTFWGWTKTKMVVGSLYIPLAFDYNFGKFDIRVKASYSRYLSGKFKLKYIEDGEPIYDNEGKVFMSFLAGDDRRKDKTFNSEFKDYYLNKNNIILSIEIIPFLDTDDKMSFGYSYEILPFFNEGKGPRIHSVSFFSSSISKIGK